MKILFFIDGTNLISGERIGGAETSIVLLAKRMSDIGHDVFLLTRYNSGKHLFKSYKKDKVKYVLIPEAVDFLKKSKTIRGKIKAFLYEKYFLLFFTINRIDLIYMFYQVHSLNYFLKILQKANKVKIVMRMAGLKWHEDILNDADLTSKYLYVFNNVDSINYISHGIKILSKNKMKELGYAIEEKHSFISDIGVDNSSIINFEKRNYSTSAVFRILVATRFSDYQKRQDLVVDALKLIKDKYDIKVTFVGDGETKGHYIDKIRECDLEGRCEILPFKNQQDLWSSMKDYDLLCHPCNYEGLSKVILESMALGLPVLASNVKAPNEYIVDGKNGFLIENSPEKWAEKITNIYKNRLILKNVAGNAKEYINKNYCSEKNVYVYEKYFKEIVLKND